MPRMFVRVRDNTTKHQFDVPEGDPRIGVSLTLLDDKRFPPSRFVRRPKHRIQLAGQKASREASVAAAADAEATTTKESR